MALSFISLWLRQPFRIASVFPSGRALAALMTRQSARGRTGDRTGAGTGVFTHALLARGVREQDLLLVRPFRSGRHAAAAIPGGAGRGSRTPRVSTTTIRLARACRRSRERASLAVHARTQSQRDPEGCVRMAARSRLLLPIHLWPRLPVQSHVLAQAGLSAERVGWVAANLPPATVYRFARKDC